MRATAFAALLALAAAVDASAQPVYRCGPDGRSYSQAPCPDGTAVDARDERSGAAQAAAQRVAERERQRADNLRQQRLAREADSKGQVAAGFYTAPKPDAAASAPVKPKKKASAKRKPRRTSAGGT